MNKAPKDTSLYETLEVAPNATLDEIKKSFRKLALIWHPDKWTNASDDEKKQAESKFKEIGNAYSIVSDPEKREQYDRFGLDAVNNGGQGHAMSEEDVRAMFESMGMGGGFGGFAEGLFGGGFGGIPGMGRGRRGEKREPVMPDLIHQLDVELKDIYLGTSIEFEVVRYNLKQDADPKKEDIVCNDCKGVGSKVILRNMGQGMMTQSTQMCHKCEGTGMILSDTFFDKKKQIIRKVVPKGVRNGEQILIPNKGHEIPPCFKNANSTNERTTMILIFNEIKECVIDNYKYLRGVNNNPNNIALELSIEAHEAVCGTYKHVPFINGKNICIKIPPGVAFKEGSRAVAIPKMGMPIYKQENKYGDLYVILKFNDTIILDESKIKQIWKIYTGKDMKAENNKTIKLGGEIVNSLTIDEFKKENDLNSARHNSQQYHEGECDDDDDECDEDHHGQGQGIPRGMPADCAQQ